MTQENYENDLPLAADSSDGDEFDGLETGAKPTGSKTPVMALIAIVLVAGAAFLTYQLFMSPSDQAPAPAEVAAVDDLVQQQSQPPVDANANLSPTDQMIADTNNPDASQAPVPEAPTSPDQVVAEALPETTPAADASAVAPSPDATAVTTDTTTPVATDATQPPVTDPAAVAPDVATTAPVSDAAAVPATAEAAPVAPAAVTPPTENIPQPAPAAAAALPTPPDAQLTPITPDMAAGVATPLPNGAPQAPSPQKVANTVNAVNEILGAEAAAASIAPLPEIKPVEVTPRAQQVIVVKKTYSANSSQATVAAGDRVLQSGQYGDAAEIYDKELKKNPSDPLALAGKALAQQKAGRTQDAMNTYQRLLDLNPRDLEALTNYLGLLQKENPSQAMARLQTLSQQYPSNAAVAGQIGMTQARMMDTPNALRSFTKAQALDPTNPTYPFNLAVLYDRLGTTDKAGEEYRKALELARNYPERADSVSMDTIRNRLSSINQ